MRRVIKINNFFIKIILKKIILKIIASFINFNLFFFKTINQKNYIYFDNISFGDTFTNYIHNYFLIKKRKIKILIFSEFEKKIINFFFNKKNILETFFLVPDFISIYSIHNMLKNKDYYKPSKEYTLDNKELVVQKEHVNLLNNLLKSKINLVSKKIAKLQKKKICLIFIKHNNKNVNDVSYSNSRQSTNFKKIYSVINFLIKNKQMVIVLGNAKHDKSINILKKHYKNNINIQFFEDLSDSYSIIDQLFIHKYSSLSIGNCSGAFIMSIYLKKKIIFFDALKTETNYYSLMHSKNIINLFKKVIFDKKLVNLSDTIVQKILNKKKIINAKMITLNKYEIKENNFEEIKKAIINIKL